MNRRTFITASTAAAIGFGANPIPTANAQEKAPMDASTQSFWPNKACLVISISMQFETAQKQKGVVFMRKDEIAKWALSAPNIPHEREGWL